MLHFAIFWKMFSSGNSAICKAVKCILICYNTLLICYNTLINVLTVAQDDQASQNPTPAFLR